MFEDLAKEAAIGIMRSHVIDGEPERESASAIVHDAINKAVTQTREQLLADFKSAREADLALIGKLREEIDHGKE